MYQQSNFSGKTKNTVTGAIFMYDDGTQNSQDYTDWRALGNGAEFVEYFDPEEVYDYNFNAKHREEENKYEQRRTDGLEYCKKNRALMKAKLFFEEINETEYSNITDALIDVRTQICFGDWEKALTLLEQQTQLIPEAIYNSMHAFIQDYNDVSYGENSLNRNALEEAEKLSIIGNRPNDR